MKPKKTIRVKCLARVEGEGGLTVKFGRGGVTDARFDIFEPPRFFEAFLRGRSYTEVPDITAPHLRHMPDRVHDEFEFGL